MTVATRGRGFPLELAAVWLLFLLVCVAMLVTYSRLPPEALYHVSGSGLDAGLGRVLVFLNFPTALVAVAIIALVAERLGGGRAAPAAAAAGIALSAFVAVPGVVDEADLDAKPLNAVCALGVGIAAALTVALAAGTPQFELARRLPGDPLRTATAAAALVLSVPWLAAELGVSFDGVPLLGTLYQTGELRTQPDDPAPHAAVHLGHHHGMDGFLLVLTALLLSRVLPGSRERVRAGTGLYLALMLVYGLALLANDFWLEQIVKRGWTDWEIPDVTRPSLSLAWVVIVVLTLGLFGAGALLGSRGNRVAARKGLA